MTHIDLPYSPEAHEALMKSFSHSPCYHFGPDTISKVYIGTTPNAVITFRSQVTRLDIFEAPDDDGHYKMMSALRDALNTFLDSEPIIEAPEAKEPVANV